MSNLYVLQYNNYFNRIVKKLPAISDYAEYMLNNAPGYNPLQNINFNPNDAINAEQVINWNGAAPDYIVVTDESNNIVSRWFVLDHMRTRAGQYKLTLRRDLVADFYDDIIAAPCYIEKAKLPSTSDLIFNDEGMLFNRIKSGETLLKDRSGCPWLVIYAAAYKNDDQGNITSTTFEGTLNIDYPATPLTKSQYDELSANAGRSVAALNYLQVVLAEALNGKQNATAYTVISDPYSNSRSDNNPFAMATGATLKPLAALTILAEAQGVFDAVKPLAPSYDSRINDELYATIQGYIGKYLSYTPPSGPTRYFKINITFSDDSQYFTPTSYAGALSTALAPFKNAYTDPSQPIYGSTILNGNIILDFVCKALQYEIVEVTAPTVTGDTFTIGATRYHLTDAPYDIFCLPLADNLMINNSKATAWTQVKSDKYLNLEVANTLLSNYAGAGQVYDAQIVPYCPLSVYQSDDTSFDLNDASPKAYSRIMRGSTTIGYIFHVSQSSFSLEIPLEDPILIQDYKIESQTDLYRLCSPNYAAVFEFNAAYNRGLDRVIVSCTYKPFTPYIKVSIPFKGLYGIDTNDARGLICSGDFSLAALTDQWKTYELNNKNYQAAFDRSIQNLDVHNDWAFVKDLYGAVTGSITGAVSGAKAGAAGGPAGAAAGAATGGILGSIAGTVNTYINETLRNEDKAYTEDQFRFMLGNIKALPQTLSRTSAYNIDNKYFPFLEYYTCSEPERSALKEKIKFNGMTVNVIGSIQQYIDPDVKSFVKGKLIRLDGISEAYSVCKEIYNEINKGVYI